MEFSRTLCVSDHVDLPRPALEKSISALFKDRAGADGAMEALSGAGIGRERVSFLEREGSCLVTCTLAREETAEPILAIFSEYGGDSNGGEVSPPPRSGEHS